MLDPGVLVGPTSHSVVLTCVFLWHSLQVKAFALALRVLVVQVAQLDLLDLAVAE